ncbi:lipoprotein 17-related variable surface protein [[Mycoplasma] testudinis]|uniref:lipoprotein 17-related variable surface protein n=1 Tax=[Mycoplasma] testudinis TaxID=33924 RepID=UPI000488DA78|nr:lipoprotein 17-related variable surface protein [[Mycoplasma] testudinis]
MKNNKKKKIILGSLFGIGLPLVAGIAAACSDTQPTTKPADDQAESTNQVASFYTSLGTNGYSVRDNSKLASTVTQADIESSDGINNLLSTNKQIPSLDKSLTGYSLEFNLESHNDTEGTLQVRVFVVQTKDEIKTYFEPNNKTNSSQTATGGQVITITGFAKASQLSDQDVAKLYFSKIQDTYRVNAQTMTSTTVTQAINAIEANPTDPLSVLNGFLPTTPQTAMLPSAPSGFSVELLDPAAGSEDNGTLTVSIALTKTTDKNKVYYRTGGESSNTATGKLITVNEFQTNASQSQQATIKTFYQQFTNATTTPLAVDNESTTLPSEYITNKGSNLTTFAALNDLLTQKLNDITGTGLTVSISGLEADDAKGQMKIHVTVNQTKDTNTIQFDTNGNPVASGQTAGIDVILSGFQTTDQKAEAQKTAAITSFYNQTGIQNLNFLPGMVITNPPAGDWAFQINKATDKLATLNTILSQSQNRFASAPTTIEGLNGTLTKDSTFSVAINAVASDHDGTLTINFTVEKTNGTDPVTKYGSDGQVLTDTNAVGKSITVSIFSNSVSSYYTDLPNRLLANESLFGNKLPSEILNSINNTFTHNGNTITNTAVTDSNQRATGISQVNDLLSGTTLETLGSIDPSHSLRVSAKADDASGTITLTVYVVKTTGAGSTETPPSSLPVEGFYTFDGTFVPIQNTTSPAVPTSPEVGKIIPISGFQKTSERETSNTAAIRQYYTNITSKLGGAAKVSSQATTVTASAAATELENASTQEAIVAAINKYAPTGTEAFKILSQDLTAAGYQLEITNISPNADGTSLTFNFGIKDSAGETISTNGVDKSGTNEGVEITLTFTPTATRTPNA